MGGGGGGWGFLGGGGGGGFDVWLGLSGFVLILSV